MKDYQDHESYGMLSFSRVSGNVNLFGSSIKHHNLIEMQVRKGSVARDLSKNWYYGREDIVSVFMSYTQFVEAITNMNTEGVPVTIRSIAGKSMEPCPFESVREKLSNEFQESIDVLLKSAATAAKKAEEVLRRPGAISKAERNEIASELFRVEQQIRSNIKFVMDQFNEQTEKSITEAKGEIEAFFSSKIHALGSEALVEHLEQGLLQAPNIVEGEDK